MAQPSRTWAVAAAVLALTMAAVVWWLGGPAGLGAGDTHQPPVGAAAATAGTQVQPSPAQGVDNSFFARRRAITADGPADPLLVHGLRDTLEALLMEAGDASDPATLKQRLTALVNQHFPAALATRALALAERYVDYRVALGSLRAPQDPTDPHALRYALEARHKVRLQFFDDAEYDALFAREADLDRYTLARLEIERNTQLSPEQRAQALQAADNELSAERRAERSAATQHMTAAAQAMAQLDREEQHWNQRLDQYSQARAQQGEGPGLQQLRQQLFSPEEQQRIDAALALRRLNAGSSGS